MAELRITHEDDAPDEDVRCVYDHLDAFNRRHVGDGGWTRVRLFLRDGAGGIAGGLLADVYLGYLYVQVLWIDEAHRGGGHGQALLRRAEEIGAERGCHSVWLDSFTFQAPGFYRKLGYEEFGRLNDYPPGHDRVFLRKTLAPAADRR